MVNHKLKGIQSFTVYFTLYHGSKLMLLFPFFTLDPIRMDQLDIDHSDVVKAKKEELEQLENQSNKRMDLFSINELQDKERIKSRTAQNVVNEEVFNNRFKKILLLKYLRIAS